MRVFSVSLDTTLDEEIAKEFSSLREFADFTNNSLLNDMLRQKADTWARSNNGLFEEVAAHIPKETLRHLIKTFAQELHPVKIERVKDIIVPSGYVEQIDGGTVTEIDGYSSLSGFDPQDVTIQNNGSTYYLSYVHGEGWTVRENRWYSLS